MPLNSPDHVSLPAYVEYLESYITKFQLSDHIRLGCRVTAISPLSAEGKWQHRLTYQADDGNSSSYDCSHIAIATGLHVTPNIPDIPGIENIPGPVFHSSQYKQRSQLKDRNVLILGCGETGMDIAYEAIKAPAKSVTMCFRTGFLSFPKVLNRFQVFGLKTGGSLPIDGLITNLFETTYVHRAIDKSRLRWFVSDFVIKRVMWFLTGTQAGCSQYVGELPKERLGRAYVFLNKSNKAMPYLNRPYKKDDPILKFLNNKYLDPPEDAESKRWVDTCTFPAQIEKDGSVVFEHRPDRKDWRRLRNTTVKPDCVCFCTGYKQDFSWLHSSYPTSSTTDVRNIIRHDRPDVAFIGFVRPGVGAIPPIAEQQAMWWMALILNIMPMPTDPPHYHLLAPKNPRIDYGVDHSAYMSTLAKDFGGAPSILELYQAHGAKVTFVYCFGASFVTFYRLLGPFKFSEAAEITCTELMSTIKRRGILGNFFFGLIPMLFYGVLNAIALFLEVVGLIPQDESVF